MRGAENTRVYTSQNIMGTIILIECKNSSKIQTTNACARKQLDQPGFESMITNFFKKKTTSLDGFPDVFYIQMMPIQCKLFQKGKRNKQTELPILIQRKDIKILISNSSSSSQSELQKLQINFQQIKPNNILKGLQISEKAVSQVNVYVKDNKNNLPLTN